MRKIDKLEQYKNIIQETKQRCGRGVSNIYFLADEIGRYIAQGRLYVEKSDIGCVFYVDEDTYYNTAVYAADNAIVPIPARNKRCVFRYVYRGKDAESIGPKFSKILSANDFHKEASSVEVRLPVEDSGEMGEKDGRAGFFLCLRPGAAIQGDRRNDLFLRGYQGLSDALQDLRGEKSAGKRILSLYFGQRRQYVRRFLLCPCERDYHRRSACGEGGIQNEGTCPYNHILQIPVVDEASGILLPGVD